MYQKTAEPLVNNNIYHFRDAIGYHSNSMIDPLITASGAYLSPPQRPLSCCFDHKSLLAIGLRREKTAACREFQEGEREQNI